MDTLKGQEAPPPKFVKVSCTPDGDLFAQHCAPQPSCLHALGRAIWQKNHPCKVTRL